MIRPSLRVLALAVVCLAMAIPAVAQSPNYISWSGDVDNTAIVYFHGHHSWVDDVTGKPVINIVTEFHADLPTDSPVTVHLEDIEGRGTVQLIAQPTADNNYTAAVKISDPQPGRGHYHFRLEW